MGRTRGLVVVALVIAAVASFVTAAAAQDRVKTKEIVVGLGAEPRTMLGVMIVDWTTNNMLEHIYDRLLDRDGKTFKPKPMLADELEDRQRHHLGVQAPQGREVPQRRAVHRGLGEGHHRLRARSGHQVALRLCRLLGPGQGSAWSSTTTPCASSPSSRGRTWSTARRSTNSLIMPAKALKELGPAKLAEKPIGTGPFKFVEWKRDERLVLERNPDYWQGPADASRVTFRFIPEFSARMAALLSGEIDVMKDVPPHAVEAIEKSGRATLRTRCPRASTTWRW